MNTIEQQQTLGRIHRQPSCEIVFFTIASGGIGEDISKRKPDTYRQMRRYTDRHGKKSNLGSFFNNYSR